MGSRRCIDCVDRLQELRTSEGSLVPGCHLLGLQPEVYLPIPTRWLLARGNNTAADGTAWASSTAAAETSAQVENGERSRGNYTLSQLFKAGHSGHRYIVVRRPLRKMPYYTAAVCPTAVLAEEGWCRPGSVV